MLIDTHAHLDFPELAGDLEAVLQRAVRNNVVQIVTIGISLAASRAAVRLAQSHRGVSATIGIHPHDARRLNGDELETLRALGQQRKVVAVGEIGLDYYRDRQPRDIQRECLRQQVELACELGLPAVFHVRDGYPDFFEIISGYRDSLKDGVMHCFSGDWQVAEKCLDMGFYLSIPGSVTFPKAQWQQDVARRAPLDRLLVETDAPFLAPVPYRGKVNEPSYVVHTAQKIARLRGCELREFARQSSHNARKVFSLPQEEIADSPE